MAEVLRDDDVGFNRVQKFKINAVEALASFEKFTHLTINRCGALCVRNARLDQDRLGSRLQRKIAFVADPGDLVAKSQRKQDFRGGRQQRTNLHASQFNTEVIPLS